MIRALAAALVFAFSAQCRAEDPAPEDISPPTGAFALAPLIGGAPQPVEPDQPVQPVASSMQDFDEHLASDTPADLERLARLSSLLAQGEQAPRPELDWARRRLALAVSAKNLARARARLMETIRREGLADDFGGDQVLPPNAPDSRIAPFVEMKLRGAREAARQLLDSINTTH